ncbi:MAG: citramalate synthase, partial [Planctomycetota bacterium]|nr:citramalate synthase [Planctomycetota bacterium]
DKVLIAHTLDALGVDYIEGGYPLSNPKDEAFFEAMRRRPLKRAKLAAFGMTRRKNSRARADEGMAALLRAETPVVTIVGKSWDLHLREVLDVSEAENVAMIAETVALLTQAGREVFFDAEHFFDGYRANPAMALATLRAAREAGAARLVLCDTNGGSLPAQIASAVQAVQTELPGAMLGVHCHNDGDLAVANTLAAVEAGAVQVQGTINGIGERCGNADLISVVGNLTTKCRRRCLLPGTLAKLTETSRYVYEIANLNLREGQPFVGAAAFAHKAGMHVHAVRRDPATYEHIAPETVGNSRRILVSELSGVSNIAATVPAKFGIGEDKDAQRRVLQAVMTQEHAGYQFEAAEASFELLIRKTLAGRWYRPLWHIDHYRCAILWRSGEGSSTEATVKLSVDGTSRHTVAEGDGPVDSLHRALREALRGHYRGVDDLHLADYKVRVVNTAAETAAKVRVLIDWHDASGQAYFGSVGVSENIIDASWLALVDAVEYKIFKDLEKDEGAAR